MPHTSARPLRRVLALGVTLGTVVAGTVVAGTVVAPAADAVQPCSHGTCTVSFASTGDHETWTVPSRVTELHAVLAGGSGAGGGGAEPGAGGVVAATVPVTPGEVLDLRVGAGAEHGGFGGGSDGSGGGGTFLSDATHLLLAAGGGGGGGTEHAGGNGGGGLTLVGAPGAGGAVGEGGGGGGKASGGAAGPGGTEGSGPATVDTFGTGGAASTHRAGYGGGGYFGGGGGGVVSPGTSSGGGGGSAYAASTVSLVAPSSVTNPDVDGYATITFADPDVATTTSTIELAADHAVDGKSTTATVTVTATGDSTFADGAVQLLVDGEKSGAPVAVKAAATTATATLTVPADGVGTHEVSASFSASDALASSTDATTFTVLPATIPWTLTDEAGDPITSPLATPEAVAHATGQLPGATVRIELKDDGQWTETGLDDTAKVAADGTVDLAITSPLWLTAFSDNPYEDTTFSVRLVAVSPFGERENLASTAKKITVPGMDLPVDLQVDPGPYRAGADVDNAVRVTLRWFDLEAPFFDAGDVIDALDAGYLTLYLDRKAVDPEDVTVGSADEETAVLTFAAPRSGGDHTVQAVLNVPEENILSASEVRHFSVAPSTFDAALLDDDGNPVTTVHPGDELHAAAAGLLEGTVVDFDLHSDPVLLGSATADKDGVAVADVTIPADAAPGKHTVVVTATDVLGDEHVQRVALTVVAEPSATPTPTPTPSATPVDDPLAATGSEVAPVVGVAALLLLVGTGLLLAARRRRA